MRFRVGLISVFVAGAACGGSSPTSYGGNSAPPPPGPSAQTVNMSDYAFSPPSLTIKVGTTVRWVNVGATSHTATSDAGVSPAWDSGTLGAPGTTTDPYGGTMATPGGSYSAPSATFSTPGTYPYHCTFHGTPGSVPGTMKGTITVTQ
jgi:plastocyanin